MAINKRTTFQKEEDKLLIIKLKRKGYSQYDIFRKINERYKANDQDITITQQQVSYDYKQIIAEWKDERLDHIDLLRTDMIDNFNYTKSVAYEAFERSIGKSSTEDLMIPDVIKKSSKFSKMFKGKDISHDDKLGDSRFLKIAIECDDKISKLQGLYIEPIKDQEVTNDDISILSDKELNDEISKLEKE